jgi:hypothetical protein
MGCMKVKTKELLFLVFLTAWRKVKTKEQLPGVPDGLYEGED